MPSRIDEEERIESDTQTAPGIDIETFNDRHLAISVCHPYRAIPRPPASRLWSNIGSWVLAVTAATSPVTYNYADPRQELRRSGASSIIWSYTRKKGVPITLRQARQLAIRILSETEQRLRQEREAEARFLLGLWEDED